MKVVVWDNIGNVLWGMRAWNEWDGVNQVQLLSEDPDAAKKVMSLAEMFREYPLELYEVHTEDELAAALPDADVLIVHKETVPPELLEQARHLRLIQHLGQDYRGVPVETARALKVPVAATPLVNYIAVAEHTWALILNHLKRLPAQRGVMAARAYEANGQWKQDRLAGLTLARDLTLGLLGFGEIARPIARVAQAFDMRTLYWDIQRFPDLERVYGVTYVDWDYLFCRSDVLSVQLALNEQTRGIVGAREFALMKPSALFINTARGKLVDQDALVRALQEERLGGAALDVFAEEPLPVDDPLHALHDLNDKVTLTPHSAWQGHWTHIRDSQTLWLNVLRLFKGEALEYLV